MILEGCKNIEQIRNYTIIKGDRSLLQNLKNCLDILVETRTVNFRVRKVIILKTIKRYKRNIYNLQRKLINFKRYKQPKEEKRNLILVTPERGRGHFLRQLAADGRSRKPKILDYWNPNQVPKGQSELGWIIEGSQIRHKEIKNFLHNWI